MKSKIGIKEKIKWDIIVKIGNRWYNKVEIKGVITMSDLTILKRPASVEEYLELRQSVGWTSLQKEVISIGLKNSLFSVCVEKDNKIIGHGRIVGDGAFTLYIQDIIVRPEYQRTGIGMKIMNEIMNHIKQEYFNDTMICLMSAKGKENFYNKFGFIQRPNEEFGAGMIQYLKK